MAAVACAMDRRRPVQGMPVPATALEPGFWECNVDGSWMPYPWPTSSILEQAYCQCQSNAEFVDRGHRYRVEFSPHCGAEVPAQARQFNAATSRTRPARRWPSRVAKEHQQVKLQQEKQQVWHAWIQAEHVWCLFEPKEDEDKAAPTLPVPVPEPYRLGGLALSEAWWPELLQRWPLDRLVRAVHPLGRNCSFAGCRITSSGNDREWAALSSLWGTSRIQAELIGAFRVQSRPLLQGFVATRQAMLARLSGEDTYGDNEASERCRKLTVRLLYHGTKRVTHLVDICNEGFDRARAQTCLYGKGCYFAASAAYSDKYACTVQIPGENRKLRAVLLAAVLVGEMAQGTSDMYPPPVKPHSRLGDRYENTCDNVSSPTIMVTFKDHQAVPAYVMIYALP